MQVDVLLTAEAAAAAPLAGRVALVVDVLRASTSIIAALAAGAAAVIPARDPEDARQRAATLPPGQALIAGERRGEPLAGFDLGNSPLEFTPARVGGRTIVFTTSNGTRALLAARPAAAVGVAALVNLAAAAAWAAAGGRDITVLCAGQRGAVSLEDHVCAGLIVERLTREDPAVRLTEAAAAAAGASRPYGKAVGRLAEDSAWAQHLSRRGRGGDVAACLALDITSLVPVYRPDVDKVVSGSR